MIELFYLILLKFLLIRSPVFLLYEKRVLRRVNENNYLSLDPSVVSL